MKFLPLILAILAAVLLGLQWVPDLAAHQELLKASSAGAVLLLIVSLLLGLKKGENASAPAVAPVPVAPPPASGMPGDNATGTEAIGLLSTFQENGRLVDFLMDDITAYSDEQVGAAARIVHQGCRGVLDQHFSIRPVCESAEGATISVPVSYRGDEYRLSGSLAGSAPFSGTVVHRGWKSGDVNLPRIVVPDGQLPNIAPAEVEVKS